ncbi:hypothetical protein AB4Z38_07830 [Arthrobacter sp. 2RAF6]|uniref:hypothetical protein n=1 Tax=Arthrobacter sp. 2RAF6 TaxID=3233002 RepID=UPI003F91536C
MTAGIEPAVCEIYLGVFNAFKPFHTSHPQRGGLADAVAGPIVLLSRHGDNSADVFDLGRDCITLGIGDADRDQNWIPRGTSSKRVHGCAGYCTNCGCSSPGGADALRPKDLHVSRRADLLHLPGRVECQDKAGTLPG